MSGDLIGGQSSSLISSLVFTYTSRGKIELLYWFGEKDTDKDFGLEVEWFG